MMTGTGMVAIRPWPHQVKAGGKPEIGPPPERSSAAPRKAVSPPSVTTNGGTRRRVMTKPCSSPPAMPTAIAASGGEDHRVALGVGGADREAVGEAALGDVGADEAGEGEERRRRRGRSRRSG